MGRGEIAKKTLLQRIEAFYIRRTPKIIPSPDFAVSKTLAHGPHSAPNHRYKYDVFICVQNGILTSTGTVVGSPGSGTCLRFPGARLARHWNAGANSNTKENERNDDVIRY